MNQREDDAFGAGASIATVVVGIIAVVIFVVSDHPIAALVLGGIVAVVGVLGYHLVKYDALPFTTRCQMAVAYARERDRRAADMVKLGLDPADALKRAEATMKKEADEILKESEK